MTSAGLVLAACHAPVSGRPVEAPPLALGRVLPAGCVGSQYRTIQAAIDAAVDGDVVEVCDGTYAEHLRVSGKRVTLRSQNGAAVTVVDAGGTGIGLSVVGGADVTVERLRIRRGWNTTKGGNVACEASRLALTGVELFDGHAGKGGGLSVLDCSATVVDALVEGNDADWAGGGVWVLGDEFEVRDTTFRSNGSLDDGGGLFVEGAATLADNLFDGNVAIGDGGGAHLREGEYTVVGNDVIGNEGHDGGGLYLFETSGEVRANTFLENVAHDEGGGMRHKLSTTLVYDNLYLRNHADNHGGGLKVSHEETVLVGNVFDSNDAGRNGGGLALEESASDLQGNVWSGNLATKGGGLYNATGWDRLLVEDSSFFSNSARERGGQLYTSLPAAPTKLRRVDVVDGVAPRGGGIYVAGCAVELTNVVLDTNVATRSGGNLYLMGATGAVTNSVLYGGSAPNGSGITVRNGVAGVTINNTVLAQHTDGAALTVESGVAPTVRYSDFSGNRSDVQGMVPVLGSNGNVGSAPAFRDAEDGDFGLAAGSALADAGDPSILDRDGSRSDIGAFGGPLAP